MTHANKRKVSYRRSNKYGQPVPGIFIEGQFLNQYGFQLGDTVSVQYQSRQIQITKTERRW